MLSIVLPAYNSSEILGKELPLFIEYLKSQEIQFEIIVVNDGSFDGKETGQVAVKNNCRFINLPRNYGKGMAVRTGVLASQGDFILFTDSDIPFHYDSVQEFLHYADFKEFDIVIGDRNMAKSDYYVKISKLRKIGSAIFTKFVGGFVAGGLYDTQCGLKAFRRNIALELFSLSKLNGFAFDVEILYLALKKNLEIKRLPVQLRNNETSSVRLFRDGIKMTIDLFRIILNFYTGVYTKKNP